MSESRTELLAWLNDLLKTNYTKVEQCGTGAAHCQIIDSIYHDVHLAKVKFDAKLQYEYVQNFKVLQSAFTAHKIDKIIPVERLIQCKFQDNLEFLQWMKKFWDSTFPGGHYDAEARRKGKAAGGGVSLTGAPRKPVGGSAGMDKAPRHPAERDIRKSNTAAAAPQKIARRAAEDASPATVDAYEKKISDLEIAVAGLQKERDFYFEKLRGIEILTQQELEGDAGPGGRNGADVGTVLKEIQDVLYSTEEGFEVPNETNGRAQAPTAEEITY